jgi:aspartyl-tRNA(Asn)/glutamyl-tRNA(Gln) amidotransferase subunit C
MAIEITEKLVEHIAILSRLALSREELSEMQGHFEKILRYVESLDKVDTGNIDPSIFPLEVHNVFGADEARPSLPVEEAVVRNAPAQRQGFFVVPRIVAQAPGVIAGEDLEP